MMSEDDIQRVLRDIESFIPTNEYDSPLASFIGTRCYVKAPLIGVFYNNQLVKVCHRRMDSDSVPTTEKQIFEIRHLQYDRNGQLKMRAYPVEATTPQDRLGVLIDINEMVAI